MIVINKIIVDKLPDGCADCQLFQDGRCYALQREDYDAKTEYHDDYRRSDCPMVEEQNEKEMWESLMALKNYSSNKGETHE